MIMFADWFFQNFYGEHRRTHLNHKLRERHDWAPESMEEWLENKSSKLQAMVDIVKWHLEEDNRPPLMLDSEEQLVPDQDYAMPATPPNAGPDRIVIYAAFPMNHPMIRAVSTGFNAVLLTTNGLRVVAGSRPPRHRDHRGQRPERWIH